MVRMDDNRTPDPEREKPKSELDFEFDVFDNLETTGVDEVRASMAQMIDDHGWCMIGTKEGDDSVPMGFNLWTKGLRQNYDHPEFQIVFPLDCQIAEDIMAIFADRVISGERFEDGEVVEGILGAGFPCKLVSAIASGRQVLRIILPDGQQRLEQDQLTDDFARQYEMLSPEQ
jgi:hypothetical protein